MKNKFSNGRLSYFFTPRTHGNVLAWVEPASASEGSKRVVENILRWEDDGGQMIDIGKAQYPQTLTQGETSKRMKNVRGS